jgi:hypothetical protein
MGIEQSLHVQRLEIDNFEPLGASNAEFGLEEMDRGGFCGNVEFLELSANSFPPFIN